MNERETNLVREAEEMRNCEMREFRNEESVSLRKMEGLLTSSILTPLLASPCSALRLNQEVDDNSLINPNSLNLPLSEFDRL